MIIFGTRGVTYAKERGNFFCPGCAGNQSYQWKRVRSFFTLYFIPLIPLNVVAEYIECSGCGGTYRKDILSHDPAAESEQAQAEYHQAIQRVMVHMMLADGKIESSEVETIRNVYTKLANTELSPAQIHQQIKEIKEIEAAGDGVLDELQAMGPYLNEHGREMVLKAAIMVADADGTIQHEEQELLTKIAEAIGMSPAHFRGILAEMKEGQLSS